MIYCLLHRGQFLKVSIKPVSESDLEGLRLVLLAEGLPVENILKAPVRFFAAHAENGAQIAWGGLEIYEDQAILRSVVVNQVLRGTGAGRKLVCELINEAKIRGLKRLWLLTISAENFFGKMGFTHAIRSEAPLDIQNSEEFLWQHNETAHCMSKKL